MDKQKKKRPARGIVALICLLILILSLWFLLRPAKVVEPAKIPEVEIDTLLITPPVVPAVEQDTTVPVVPRSRPVSIKPVVPPDPPAEESIDTVVTAAPPDPCASDTTALWVFPDPSGGLHRGGISVRFEANKPCTIEWRFGGESQWRRYDPSEHITIGTSVVLEFHAVDTCGNRMARREESYEIHATRATLYCPPDMEYIEVGTLRFCIDRYEWPNKKGHVPLSYISLYQAMDSCYSVDKRLCTSEEWSTACAGPRQWRYPYGQRYEERACCTADTTVRRSGSRRECRGYFDVYDMSGNLAEWTSTRSSKDPQFYNVMGGFWESGLHSGCTDARYSYYPQNRHNPVGFRCCRDAALNSGKK